MTTLRFRACLFGCMIVFAESVFAERIVDKIRDLQGFFSQGTFEIVCKGTSYHDPSGIFSVRKTLFGDIEIRLKRGIDWLAITPRSFSDAGVLFTLDKRLSHETLILWENVTPTDPTVRSLTWTKKGSYTYSWNTSDKVDAGSKIGIDFELDFVEQKLRSKGINYSHPIHAKAEGIFFFQQLKSDVQKDSEEFKHLSQKASEVIDQLRSHMPLEYGNPTKPGTAYYRAYQLEGFADELFKLGDKVIRTDVGKELWLTLFEKEGWPRSARYLLSKRRIENTYDKKTGVPKAWHRLASEIFRYHLDKVRGYREKIPEAEWERMKPVIVERWFGDLARVVELYSSTVNRSFNEYQKTLPEKDFLTSDLEFHFQSLPGIGIYARTFQTADCELLGN